VNQFHKSAAGGNIVQTAEAMGYDRSYLYRRMKTLGINGKPNKQ
jgi:transcriptional regulator of acetoin/glycerol metabolism